ncbi:hypothetical protein BJ546DRAFT_956092 [Cryomyces antarcticus]
MHSTSNSTVSREARFKEKVDQQGLAICAYAYGSIVWLALLASADGRLTRGLRARSAHRIGDAPVLVDATSDCRTVVYSSQLALPRPRILTPLADTHVAPEAEVGDRGDSAEKILATFAGRRCYVLGRSDLVLRTSARQLHDTMTLQGQAIFTPAPNTLEAFCGVQAALTRSFSREAPRYKHLDVQHFRALRWLPTSTPEAWRPFTSSHAGGRSLLASKHRAVKASGS